MRKSSPFKKKGSTIRKSSVGKRSNLSVSKRISTIDKEDMKSQLDNIDQQNVDALGSLVQEQDPNQPSDIRSEILRRDEDSQIRRKERESRIKSNLRSNIKPVGSRIEQQSQIRESSMKKKDNEEVVEIDNKEEPPIEPEPNKQSIEPEMIEPPIEPEMIEKTEEPRPPTPEMKEETDPIENAPPTESELVRKSKQLAESNYNKTKNISFTNFEKYGAEKEKEEKPKDWPKQEEARKLYGENKGVILTILTLKKLVKHLDDENTSLKKKNLDFKIREAEYKTTIKSLAARLETLELENRLVNERPSDHIKFDIEDLNKRLKVMDDNLQKATGENSQEQFLDDVVTKNKEFMGRSKDNTHSMKKLKDHLALLKTTLMNVNAR